MKYFPLVYFFFLSITLSAQSFNGYDFSLDGHWVGDNNSAAAFQSYSLRAKLITQPLKQGARGIMTLSVNDDFVEINFNDHPELFKDLKYSHSIGMTIGYFRQLRNSKWSFASMLIPQLNSNFTNGISADDLYLTAVALLNYSKQKNSRFSFGLAYANTLGFPAPIPVVNYWKAWNEKWEMNLGFPRINITRHFNSKNSLVAFMELKGYNGNISKNITNPIFKQGRVAQRISYQDVLTGLEWQYHLKKFQFKINTSYTVNRKFELQNASHDTTYKFDMSRNFNVGVGVGFNL